MDETASFELQQSERSERLGGMTRESNTWGTDEEAEMPKLYSRRRKKAGETQVSVWS